MCNEQLNKDVIWNPFFFESFAGFKSIWSIWQKEVSNFIEDWPTIHDYNLMAHRHYQATSLPSIYQVSFVPQIKGIDYEAEVFNNRCVPTRFGLWHDFFNNLSWLAFPRTKRALIERCMQERREHKSTVERTARQNLLAHFDECGMVICSDEPSLFADLKAFKWKKVFYEEKEKLLTHAFPLIMGHGILEKALAPYIGLTAKSIFLEVSSSFFALSLSEKINTIDEKIAAYLLNPLLPAEPKTLNPLPILGWPDWHFAPQDEKFYNNKQYFRDISVTLGNAS